MGSLRSPITTMLTGNGRGCKCHFHTLSRGLPFSHEGPFIERVPYQRYHKRRGYIFKGSRHRGLISKTAHVTELEVQALVSIP